MTHERNSNRRWPLIAAPLAALVVSAAAQFSLAADDQPAARPDDAPAVLTITGVVRDAFVGRPISGAKVIVYQDTGPQGEQKLVERMQTLTDANGSYSFAWRTNDPQNQPQSRAGSTSDVFPL